MCLSGDIAGDWVTPTILQITPILRFVSSFISLKRQKLFIKFCIQEGHTKLTPSNSVYSHVWNVWFITRLVDIKPALYLLLSDNDKQQLLTIYSYERACNVVRFLLSSFPRSLLWPPDVIGQAIIFFVLWFLLSIFLSFSFFLASAVADWMSTILPKARIDNRNKLIVFCFFSCSRHVVLLCYGEIKILISSASTRIPMYPSNGRGQGHVSHFKMFGPQSYLWNE